jgi:hypothetical protein
VIREYDTFFGITPYKTEHRIPSKVPGCGLCCDRLYHEIISDRASVSGMIQFIPVDSFPASGFIQLGEAVSGYYGSSFKLI